MKTILKCAAGVVSAGAVMMFSGCGAGLSPTTSVPPTPAIHNEWTWVSGANTGNQLGIYGSQGTAAASNMPGARAGAVSWTDKSGTFWLFGGVNDGGINGTPSLNDLWQYNSGQWTWVGGSNATQQRGTYGTQGIAAAGNIPSSRSKDVSWVDGQGSLWLMGGEGVGLSNGGGYLNDLWRYTGGEWTWMTGDNAGSQGYYGARGVAGPSYDTPGSRSGAVSWTDQAGNLWLFGGWGRDSNGLTGDLNDLWKYSAGQWIWMTGANVANPASAAVYGAQGTAAAGNTPGARDNAVTWTDSSGNFWLFGGVGYDSAGRSGLLNDLWKYSAGQWSWIAGSKLNGGIGTYGSQGIAATSSAPGGRRNAVTWATPDGSLWLFGGFGFDSTGTAGDLNDLWKFSGNQWTWMSGSNIVEQAGTYGTKGVAATANIPPAREQAVSWVDASGNLWLFGGWSFLPTQGSARNDLWEYQP